MTLTNDVSAITPEVWSLVLQDNLYKSLVGFGVANIVTKMPLGYGDVINKQYFTAVTAAAYTPDIDMVQDQLAYSTDQLTVNRKFYTCNYVDDIEQLQANVDIQKSILDDATYQLKNIIDSEILWNVSAGTTAAAAQLNYGDIAVAASYHLNSVSAGTAEMVPIFANATKTLLDQNCENFGDWCAVITPRLASKLAQKSTGLGFNFADSALRNGYVGDFMGFQIYVSNNVLATAATGGGPSGYHTSFTGLSDVCDCYFGRKGMIDVVLQAAPRVEIKDQPLRIGKAVIMWSLWGDTVYTRNKSRFLDAIINLTANSTV
jgi:hypothetical protein